MWVNIPFVPWVRHGISSDESLLAHFLQLLSERQILEMSVMYPNCVLPTLILECILCDPPKEYLFWNCVTGAFPKVASMSILGGTTEGE